MFNKASFMFELRSINKKMNTIKKGFENGQMNLKMFEVLEEEQLQKLSDLVMKAYNKGINIDDVEELSNWFTKMLCKITGVPFSKKPKNIKVLIGLVTGAGVGILTYTMYKKYKKYRMMGRDSKVKINAFKVDDKVYMSGGDLFDSVESIKESDLAFYLRYTSIESLMFLYEELTNKKPSDDITIDELKAGIIDAV